MLVTCELPQLSVIIFLFFQVATAGICFIELAEFLRPNAIPAANFLKEEDTRKCPSEIWLLIVVEAEVDLQYTGSPVLLFVQGGSIG